VWVGAYMRVCMKVHTNKLSNTNAFAEHMTKNDIQGAQHLQARHALMCRPTGW
jgi:glycine cleavage system aminomethyltransferase T